MGNWLENTCARVTPRSCLISLICFDGGVPTPSPCALITPSMSTWCPGDDPVIGRTTEASTGRYNCSLRRKLLWSALTSKLFPILPAETENLQSPLTFGTRVRNRGLDEPLFELSTMRLG